MPAYPGGRDGHRTRWPSRARCRGRDRNRPGNRDPVRSLGGVAIAHQTDVGRPDDVQAVVQATLDRFGGIDAIANCAAVVDRNETMLTGGIDDFDQVVNVNLRGAWLLIRAGAKAMMGSGTPGAIVWLCSSSASYITGTCLDVDGGALAF